MGAYATAKYSVQMAKESPNTYDVQFSIHVLHLHCLPTHPYTWNHGCRSESSRGSKGSVDMAPPSCEKANRGFFS